MKQTKLTILLTVLMSMVGAKVFAHDFAVANTDGVTIYYVYNGGTTVSVSYQYPGDYGDFNDFNPNPYRSLD